MLLLIIEDVGYYILAFLLFNFLLLYPFIPFGFPTMLLLLDTPKREARLLLTTFFNPKTFPVDAEAVLEVMSTVEIKLFGG